MTNFFYESIIPPDPFDFLSWAENNFRLPPGDKIQGLYRSDLTPYTRDILKALSPDHPATKIVVEKCTQGGFTTISNIVLSAIPTKLPAHCMMVFPTVKMAEKHVKKKLVQSWRRSNLKDIIGDPKKKDGSTLLYREFPGGSFSFAGAGSIDSQRSDTIRFMLLTDVDSEEFDVGGEGDPIEIFERRTDAYGRQKKIYIESTPLISGNSLIDREYKASSMGEFAIPCPHCDNHQVLEFGGKAESYGFKFEKKDGRAVKAWFICRFCSEKILEKHKYDAMLKGKYIHKKPDLINETIGFKVNSFYSPVGFVSWVQIANEWIRAQGNYKRIQVFFNTRLARTYELPGTKRASWEKLKKSAEDYPLLALPNDQIVLSLGVDTHDDRLTYMLVAFGQNMEAWVLYFGEFFGDPNNPVEEEPWISLSAFMDRVFYYEGRSQKIVSVAQDMLGHRTEAVKRFWRHKEDLRYIITAGNPSNVGPIIGMPRYVDYEIDGQKIKEGAQFWPINTHALKNEIMAGYQGQSSNRIHFSKKLDDEVFKQLTAEEMKLVVNKDGYPVYKWVNTRPGAANHAFDCLGLAYAGVLRILPSVSFEELKILSGSIVTQKDTAQKAPPPQEPKKVIPETHRSRSRARLDW